MGGWLILLLVSLAGSAAQGNTNTQDAKVPIGHVTASEGLWCDSAYYDCTVASAKNIIGRMYPVRNGAKFIRIGALTGHEWLRIRSYITGSEVTFNCSIAVDCKDVPDLNRLYPAEGAAEPDGILAAFLKVIRRMASTEPVVYERYRQGVMRAESLLNNLQDTLARLDARGLHLDQALVALSAGNYYLELCRIDQRAGLHCSSEPHPVKFHWNPGRPQPWVIRNFQPGLYRLYICQQTSKGFVRTDSYASVLAVSSATYQRLNHEFRDVVTVTKGWAHDDPTATTMLRMYLQDMAFRPGVNKAVSTHVGPRASVPPTQVTRTK